MNSYKKSGPNSCKLLVMTATPFTNSPLELFKLINLFYTNESEKIITEKEEFKKQYMNKENVLTENGVKNIANKLSGYISYLNREKDPTQFAQPIMINVPVLLSHIDDSDFRKAVYLNKKINNVSTEVIEQIKTIKIEIKKLKAEYKEKNALAKESKNAGIAKCNADFPNASQKDEKKKCLEQFKQEYEALNNNLKELIDKMNNLQEEFEKLNEEKEFGKNSSKEMKDKLKLLKNSLIQEYILYKKCTHLKYIKLKDTKSPINHDSNSYKKSNYKTIKYKSSMNDNSKTKKSK